MKTAQDGLLFTSLEMMPIKFIATITVDGAWMDIKLKRINCLHLNWPKSFECFKRIIRSYQTHLFFLWVKYILNMFTQIISTITITFSLEIKIRTIAILFF
jgi:hypothetical protein